MHLPSVTAGYLAVLALVYAVLSMQVVGCDKEIRPPSATVAAPSFAARSARTRILLNTCRSPS